MRLPKSSWRTMLTKLGYKPARHRRGARVSRSRDLRMESLETRELLTMDPIAEAGGPYTVPEGGTVVLDGSASYDPDGPNRIVSYAWDLDGDGSFGETGPDAVRGDETRIRPTFSAAGLDGPGTYSVGLKVTDLDGRTNLVADTATVSITNVAPTLSIDGAPTIQEGGALP